MCLLNNTYALVASQVSKERMSFEVFMAARSGQACQHAVVIPTNIEALSPAGELIIYNGQRVEHKAIGACLAIPKRCNHDLHTNANTRSQLGAGGVRIRYGKAENV